MTITIYHNPDCGTSRNTLAMIRASGEEPQIIEYRRRRPPATASSNCFKRWASPLASCCARTCRHTVT